MAFLINSIVLLSFILQLCISQGTATVLIRSFESAPQPMPFTHPLHVRLHSSRDQDADCLTLSYTFLVDTGSTGIVTRVNRLNVLASEPKTPGAYLFLSSSKILHGGFWVNRWVWFNKGAGSEARTQVQVLAVKYKCRCPAYVVGRSGAYCFGRSPWGLLGTFEDGPISLMGIGFGRTYDGQEQSMPDKNVLLNVVKIGGISITSTAVGTTYSPGGIIDKDGITLGLTNSNWSPFASYTVSLPAPTPNPPPPRYMWQWGEIPGTCTVAAFTPSDCNDPDGCSILIDTGISYRSARSQVTPHVDFPQDPSSLHLRDGQSVAVSLGLGGALAISETFTSGSPGTRMVRAASR